jgi:hypothetical protein
LYILRKQTVHVETIVLLSHKSPDSHISVTVEFGEKKGQVPLDDIVKRVEKYREASKPSIK